MKKVSAVHGLALLGLLEFVAAGYGYGVHYGVPCPTKLAPEASSQIPTTVIPEAETRAAAEWRDPRDPDGDSIIGLAGVDYPVLASIPQTNFTCPNASGYYADPEASCQAFHVCLEIGGYVSFMCPNGTVFNEAFSVCDWWYNVKCGLDDAGATSAIAEDPTSTSSPEAIPITGGVPPLVELQTTRGETERDNNENFFGRRRPLFSQAHFYLFN